MMATSLRLPLLLAAIAASAAQAQTILGGWTSATVTQDDVNLLVQVASDASYYTADVSETVCLIAVTGLSTQSVAGTNYKFQVAGCAVDSTDDIGACTDRDCDQSSYDVVVFEALDGSLELTSVSSTE